MTQDKGRTSTGHAEDTGGQSHEDAGLAKALAHAYQKASSGDAYHERSGASSAPGEQPSALVPRKQGEAVPSTDPAPEDKLVKGSHRAPGGAANGSPTVSDEALQRGLTPGEMGAGKEPQETTKARLAPRYSDAELSGIESGETGEETRTHDPAREGDSEVSGVPMKHAAKPDEPVAGAAKSGGKWSDAEMNGIETGEMGSED